MGLKLVESESAYEINLASVQYEWMRGMIVGLYLMDNIDHRLNIAYNGFIRPVKKRSAEVVTLVFKGNEVSAISGIVVKYCLDQMKYLRGESEKAATSLAHLKFGMEEVMMLKNIVQIILNQAQAQGYGVKE